MPSVSSSVGEPRVPEWSGKNIGWVQGRLLVPLNPAWGSQTAEVAYPELQAVLLE